MNVSNFTSLFAFIWGSVCSDPLLFYSAIFVLPSMTFKLQCHCMHSSVNYGSIEFILDLKYILSYLLLASAALTSCMTLEFRSYIYV